jgi:3-oxoacyl-(acyl-carrier-protein) synthase
MQVAVVGIGIVSALGIGVEKNFRALSKECSGISMPEIVPTSISLPVGELKMTNKILKQQLGINHNKLVSRTALLGMLAAQEAYHDAFESFQTTDKIALISATSVGGMDISERFFREYMVDEHKGRIASILHHDCADSTLAIANYLHIPNENTTTISTACSSAANAIMLGARLIKSGIYDYVIVGGTDALCAFTINGFNSLKILDTKPCRPFDTTREGLNLGEGAAYLVLQRSDKPMSKCYGYISGYANANDATHQTATSEEGIGAYLAMSNALRKANLLPTNIDYINVHGTATINNDASEGAAMLRLFAKIPKFSSTKPFTGHTLAAAGALEAVFSILSLHKGVIYRNLNYTQCDNNQLTPQQQTLFNQDIKHVLSNSFGFGGNCSSLIFSKSLLS